MKINIFGVGRSGTKAIQLYLAYILAKKEGQIKVNYEPYLYLDRKGKISYEGVLHHKNAPQFSSQSYNFSKKHINYLQRLVGNSPHVVSKFIKANGRIEAIQQAMKVDYNILVIRKLTSVLASISTKNWNYYSQGFPYLKQQGFSIYNPMLSEALQKNFIDRGLYRIAIKQSGELEKNAIYWYIMNKAGLLSKLDNLFVCSFHKLDVFSDWCNHKITPTSLKIEAFQGQEIQTDNYIKTIKTFHSSKLDQYKIKANEYLFNKGYTSLMKLEPGELIELNEKKYEKTSSTAKAYDLMINLLEKSWIKDCAAEIEELIDNIRK